MGKADRLGFDSPGAGLIAWFVFCPVTYLLQELIKIMNIQNQDDIDMVA